LGRGPVCLGSQSFLGVHSLSCRLPSILGCQSVCSRLSLACARVVKLTSYRGLSLLSSPSSATNRLSSVFRPFLSQNTSLPAGRQWWPITAWRGASCFLSASTPSRTPLVLSPLFSALSPFSSFPPLRGTRGFST